MTNIEQFFKALEKEGLYNGRIAVAGEEYRFPGESSGPMVTQKIPAIKYIRLLKFASLFIILVLIGFVFTNLLVQRQPESKKKHLENINVSGQPAVLEKVSKGPEITGKDSEVKGNEQELAGVKFYRVNNNEYSFTHISKKIFLYKIKSTGSDIRLIINDIIDIVNKQAKKVKLEALVLTPRFVINEHLVKLWQDGYLGKWQIFMIRKGEARLVKKTNSDLVSIAEISDWETLSKNKKVFTRIILKKAED